MIEGEDAARNLIGLVRMYLHELGQTTQPEHALELCRNIYNTGAIIIPKEEIIRAIERRMPTPRPGPAEDISLSTNCGKLVMARPLGELDNQIIYMTITPVGAYFGAVMYTKNVTKEDFIPAWDNDAQADEHKPTPAPIGINQEGQKACP